MLKFGYQQLILIGIFQLRNFINASLKLGNNQIQNQFHFDSVHEHNVSNSAKINRRSIRDLNFNNDYFGDDISYSSKFLIEILPDSQLRKDDDGFIHIRFRIRPLNSQSNLYVNVYAYSLYQNNYIKLFPSEGYNDAIYLLSVNVNANIGSTNNRVIIVALSNDWIALKAIKIRNNFDMLHNEHDSNYDTISDSNNDKTDTKIDYTIHNSCKNSWYADCHDAKWSFRFSVVDYVNGIYEITSNPYIIYTLNDFIAGTNQPIYGYSTASCCVRNVELIVLNSNGRITTKVINAYETNLTITSILAITLGVILFILIIIFIIAFIIYKRRRNQSRDLSTYRSN